LAFPVLQDRGRFYSVQSRHGEVKEYQISFRFFGFFNGVNAVNSFTHHEFRVTALQQESDGTAHRCAVIRGQHILRLEDDVLFYILFNTENSVAEFPNCAT
jgi:hypothetical protein